jgi:spore coat polysaccharide biosynthesis protein SpsF
MVGIVIQARMGSTRLYGKVLKLIAGKALLDHVLERLILLKFPVNKIIVATTVNDQDDVIVQHCLAKGVEVFRGSETDVLSRYFECAKEFGLEHVVRLTADNPFTDIEELQRLIHEHLTIGNDYTHSFGHMPLGVGAEIFTFLALEKSAREAYASNQREHVNEYFQENSKTFKISTLEISVDKYAPDLRLTVDTEEDYKRACVIAGYAPGRWIKTVEAIHLCTRFA